MQILAVRKVVDRQANHLLNVYKVDKGGNAAVLHMGPLVIPGEGSPGGTTAGICIHLPSRLHAFLPSVTSCEEKTGKLSTWGPGVQIAVLAIPVSSNIKIYSNCVQICKIQWQDLQSLYLMCRVWNIYLLKA